MVERVEELAAKLQAVAVFEEKALGNRGFELVKLRSVDNVASGVTEREGRRHHKRFSVEPPIDAALGAGEFRIPDEVRPGAQCICVRRIAARIHRERKASLRSNYPGELPAAEGKVESLVLEPERQTVDERHRHPVTQVKRRPALLEPGVPGVLHIATRGAIAAPVAILIERLGVGVGEEEEESSAEAPFGLNLE